ncbi:hypothetical protein K1T71_015232 [Dendrolimus kikuchii]|nr:hypothetical protein K1T71_015232 [Dendrolimus kikuchii]
MRLDLRDNRLGCSGLQAILNAMKENTTLTQIDLDDVTESPTRLALEDGEAAAVARLTRDIRALCRRNEPDATSPERRVHRKISLTCNTTCLVRVTRVTPDRESSTDSSSPSTPTRPPYCPAPSRFKVVQVAEPPQIQVHPASNEPRKSLSRFSVTRNYDKMYNPSPSPSPVPSSGSDTPAEDTGDDDSVKDVKSDENLCQRFEKSEVKTVKKVDRGNSHNSHSKCDENIQNNSETVSNISKINSQSVIEKVQSDKRTASNKFSVSSVSEKVQQDSRNANNDKQLSTSIVEDLDPSSKTTRRLKSGSNKRFSVCNVMENSSPESTQNRFSTSVVTEGKQAIPSTSHSDIETLSNNERTKLDVTSQVTTVNITPIGSEIIKRFSITDVPENVRRESSQISDDMDISSIKRISSPDNVVTTTQFNDSVTTPLNSKNRLKSCMRNSENNWQGTLDRNKENNDDVRILRRENSETSEVLCSHPNLKTISDLFKSLEVYGNTADNTVSLTSLTESKRPSVRDLFINQPDVSTNLNSISVSKLETDNSNIEDNKNDIAPKSEIDNITDLTVNITDDHARELSEIMLLQYNSESTTLDDKNYHEIENIAASTDDSNPQYKVGVSIDKESHHNTSIGISTDSATTTQTLQCKQTFRTIGDDLSHQIDIAMDVLQSDEFDKHIAISENDRDNNLREYKMLPVVVFEDYPNTDTAIIVHNQSKRSDSDDILEIIYERKKLHSVEEEFTKIAKSENIISRDVAKNVPVCGKAHTDLTLYELSPGSTPHPSQGVKTFVMPEFYIDDDIHTGKSDTDYSRQIYKLTQPLVKIDTGHTENVKQINKDDIVESIFVQTQGEWNLSEIDTIINKNDLKNNMYMNEKVMQITIEDELPVFDAKPLQELCTTDNKDTTIRTNVFGHVHHATIGKDIIEWDKDKVPDLARNDSIQVLQTGIFPPEYSSNESQKTQDLKERNKDFINVLHISEKDMPTFLPATNISSTATDLGEFDVPLLQSEYKALKEISQSNKIMDLLVNDKITLSKVLEVQEGNDNLPGAIKLTLIDEIPIYSISQLANIPGTSRTTFNATDVTTQTYLPEFDVDLSSQALSQKDSMDLFNLPGIVPDTCRQITRLTQTEIDLNNLPGISKQIEITPRQTELSIKESRYRSVNLPGTISVVHGNKTASDFTSEINSDTNFGLEIKALLEEFSDAYTTRGLPIAKATKNVLDTKNIEEITSSKRKHQTKNSISKESIIGSELNLLDVKNNSEREACKHIGDASDSSVIKNTNSEQFKKEDASADQIIYQTFVGNQDISDKANLIYSSVGDNSEVNISASVLDKDSKNVGSSTVDSKCTKMDSICDQKKTVGDDRDKNVVDSNKHDQYKDISKVLTHNETIDAGLIKSETQLVKNTIEIADEQKIDIEFKMTVKKENLDTNISTFNTVAKKEDPLKQIELITKDLSDLIDEMKVVTGDRDRKEGAKAKVIEIDKKINSNNEPEKHLEDLQVYERELERVGKTLISGCEVETDEREEERLKSSLEMSDLEIIRDINETEQYVKYLRGNETILSRDRELENDGKSSVTHKTIESHTGTETHVLETERHRKESVIERRYMDDHKKELDTERGKKEVKNKPARIKESVLKKNKSESSLDSSDMEVSRLMNKHINPFCDSSSSLEISGSSIESLTEPKLIITKDGIDSDLELDRRKKHTLSTGSSVESTDVTPMNTNLLNMSMSSNESVSPIFGKTKNIRDSLSSLEASVSSLESNRQDRVMVTSADSGIEHSLPKDIHESSSNEGTLTNPLNIKHDTLTASPKRASSLLDVPALKSKGLDRMRKISWVAPSSSFNVAKRDDKDVKPSHLEKLLSLFQHPSSIFSRSTEEEKKSCTPTKKDSLLTSSFWSWGSGERDKDDSSEATDSTLSERVQVSFIDESFSKKLDSKTPSTDTENTLSEFQTFIHSERDCENVDTCKVTFNTTDKSVVQIDLSLKCTEANNGNRKVSNSLDVVSPNDLNKNFDNSDCNKNSENSPEITEHDLKKDEKPEMVRPRSFAAVLKASGSENSLEKQNSPEGQPVDKLPSKVIRGIKENISPENTLTSSMSNTKALALELSERQLKNQPVVNTVWELTNPLLDKGEEKSDLAPIAAIEETGDESADLLQLDYIDDDKAGQKEVDVAKDALSYLMYETQTFDPAAKRGIETPGQSSLAYELKEAEIKELFDLSPELIIDEAIEVPEVFTAKDVKGIRTSPIIPERAKLKKSNSLEDLKTEMETNPKAKTIVFKVPESKPRDIPERSKLRSRSGSSPKSLPESLNKPCPSTKIDPISKKKKKVSSLGKMAKDSLLALNMSEEEIAEFRRSYKLTSVESLRSLESVSEDANSQSGNSLDSRCRACLRTSQESLMSLDSITEDVCRCNDGEKPGKSHR